jgi:uncharacterized membrane protein YedE/YeeE
MLKMVVNLFAGTLFGLGLAISGMVNPQKIIGFLDFAGEWDPTLAFVMGGALLVAIPAFRLILRRSHPVLADDFDLPTKKDVDGRLLGGAALFGIGWGLAGFCPGGSVAALASGLLPVFAFVAAMVAGMALYKWVSTLLPREGGHPPGRKSDRQQGELRASLRPPDRRRGRLGLRSFPRHVYDRRESDARTDRSHFARTNGGGA